MTVRALIREVYRLRDFQIVGGPSWATGNPATAEHFDIQATMPRDAQPDVVFAMVRSLLRDRFQLRAHSETQPTAVYALTVSRPGVLVPPSGACASAPAPNGLPRCGTLTFRPGTISGRSVRIDQRPSEN